MLVLLFIHALLWRFFHSFALGYLLRAQSERKFLVRHFMKNYFHAGDVRTSAIDEAFSNWKQFYNMSLCMTYGLSATCLSGQTFTDSPSPASFIALALKTYSIPVNWGVGDQLLRHVLGAVRPPPD
jgi:phosphatidylethanolamine N-methyltransferase